MNISTDTPTLGDKIRYFRQRAGLSQLRLELAIGAAQGSISRIENDKINPTKETIQTISQQLKLNDREVAYLNGMYDQPASQDQVDAAIQEIKDYFDRRDTLAYLLDERHRFLYFSKGFLRLFSAFLSNPEQVIRNITGQNVISLLLNQDLGIAHLFEQGEAFEKLLRQQLSRFYLDVLPLFQDHLAERDLKIIKEHSLARKIWQEVQESPANLYCLESKEVTFRFKNIPIKMSYTREQLLNHPRFEMIEYIPTNALVKLMTKL